MPLVSITRLRLRSWRFFPMFVWYAWGRTLGVLGFEMVFKFGFPVFGLLASVTWVRYIRRPSESSGMAVAP
jgi:hypothetical protein